MICNPAKYILSNLKKEKSSFYYYRSGHGKNFRAIVARIRAIGQNGSIGETSKYID
jgi:cytosine/uracil/thiamine/allantoin permease